MAWISSGRLMLSARAQEGVHLALVEREHLRRELRVDAREQRIQVEDAVRPELGGERERLFGRQHAVGVALPERRFVDVPRVRAGRAAEGLDRPLAVRAE